MLSLSYGEEYKTPSVLLLGGFDGFHKGHMRLVEYAKKTGLPLGVTFLSGIKAGGDLFTMRERESLAKKLGFAFAVEIAFTESFQIISAEAFLTTLFHSLNVKEIVAGEDFRFGKGALGDVALLKKLAPCPVTALPLLKTGEEKISASFIKSKLSEGDLPAVNELLSEPYFITGEVEHGRKVGRTYGFPTLNLTFEKGKYPLKEGVYCGLVDTPKGKYPSIIHFGARPTFGVAEKKIEAYLEGFSGDLYGATVSVYPARFLRPIVKFENEAALRNQLLKDKETLRNVL